MSRYEIYIVFETPNGIIQIYMYAYKHEFKRYVFIEIDGHEIPEEKFIYGPLDRLFFLFLLY